MKNLSQNKNNPNSEKELFLQYLQLMDIEKLDLILDGRITYFETSKDNFLKKLEYVFSEYRLSGANKAPFIKQDKLKKHTYYLKLPAFKISITFIIEENNNKITRIYNNKMVKSKEQADDIDPFELYFGFDERVGFEPSTEYLILLYQCQKAYRELENQEKVILTSDDMREWIKTHAPLYSDVEDLYHFFKMNDFRNMYLHFQLFLENLDAFPEVQEALLIYNDCKSALDKADWLDDYNRLAYTKVLGFDQSFINIDYDNRLIQFMSYSNIYFTGDDFFALIKFCKIYFGYVL